MAKKQKKHHEQGQGGQWLVIVDGAPLRNCNGFLLRWSQRWAAEQTARAFDPPGSVKAG